MTRQRLTVIVDALTVEGPPLSRAALACAIEMALAEKLAPGGGDLQAEAGAMARMTATARATPQDRTREASVGRAVASAVLGGLKR